MLNIIFLPIYCIVNEAGSTLSLMLACVADRSWVINAAAVDEFIAAGASDRGNR